MRIQQFYIIFILLLVLISFCSAYELPEVIGYMRSNPPYMSYPNDFCCIGDHNGDNCDDLLFSHEEANHVELYWGGEQMNEDYGMLFEPYLENQQVCENLVNVGNISGAANSYFCFLSWIPDMNHNQKWYAYLNLYQGQEDLDASPDIFLVGEYRVNGRYIGYGYNKRKTDINNDGFNDLLVFQESPPNCKFQIFFGGADFDTIPDFEYELGTPVRFTSRKSYSSGYDVNGDGYDDMIITDMIEDEYYFHIFLGSEEPDTIPAVSIRDDQFEGRLVNKQLSYYSLLPDINNDGYDDWGISWFEFHEGYENDGIYIFYGGENPDGEPDLELEGHRRLWSGSGVIAGGDFNGDGIGDVVTCWACSNPDMGEIHIHFGTRWMDSEADIYIDSEHDYDGRYFRLGGRVGAVGDYNGDGVDDFVVTGIRPPNGIAVVFAGNRDWELGIERRTKPLKKKEFALSAYPNPFNEVTNIDFDLPSAGDLRVAVIDMTGGTVEDFQFAGLSAGLYEWTWNPAAAAAGIYLVRAEFASKGNITNQKLKVVYLK